MPETWRLASRFELDWLGARGSRNGRQAAAGRGAGGFAAGRPNATFAHVVLSSTNWVQVRWRSSRLVGRGYTIGDIQSYSHQVRLYPLDSGPYQQQVRLGVGAKHVQAKTAPNCVGVPPYRMPLVCGQPDTDHHEDSWVEHRQWLQRTLRAAHGSALAMAKEGRGCITRATEWFIGPSTMAGYHSCRS